MMTSGKTRFVWSLGAVLTLVMGLALLGSAAPIAAQDDAEEMFNLGIVAVNCDIQAPTNITVQEEGCRPAEGVVFTVSVDMVNGEGIGSCKAKVADVPNPITAGCSIPIPFGASVSVNQDPSTVPAGYEIVQNAQKFTAPEKSETGDVGGVIFVNLLQTDQTDEESAGGGDTGTPAVVDQLPKTGTGIAEDTHGTAMAGTAILLGIVAAAGATAYRLKARAA